MSNQATIPCPECGHAINDLLEFIYDLDHYVVGHRLHCRACEHVFHDYIRIGDRRA